MPTYAYKCTECDYRFEVRQRFSDEPLTECPVCHGLVRRVITPVTVVFKGSGFYVTDNKQAHPNGVANGKGRSDETAKPEKTKEKKEPVAKSKTSSESTSSAASAAG
jgi:putative FmdB family regulatory protein